LINTSLCRQIRYAFAGALAATGFAPINLFPAFVLAVAWLFVQTHKNERCRPLDVFVFFLFMHMCGLYWLVYPLTINIKIHGWLIPLALFFVPAYLSVQLLVAWYLAKKIAGGMLENILLWPSLCCMAMYLYGHFAFGFPWLLPAYIWGQHEIFLQTISIYGVYGLSLVTMIISCLGGASYVFYKKNYRPGAVATMAAAVVLGIFLTLFGIFRTDGAKTSSSGCRARIVQCNLSQAEKNNSLLSHKNLHEHLKYSYDNSDLDFIVWPEASFPYLYHEKLEWFHDVCRGFLKNGACLVAGAIREDSATSKIYNSIVAIDHLGKNVLNYDKTHLVPFGEYVPFRAFIPSAFQSIASSIGDFDVGESPRVLTINGLKFALSICYEAAFSENFLAKNGDWQQLDALINVTNDAWFGPTSQPYQHLQIVRCRSIETGLPLIRCTNYGISAVFDPYGREICRIDINTSGAADFFIPKKNVTPPPYRQYGDTIFWIMILLLLLISSTSAIKSALQKVQKWIVARKAC
jgi:apolipoprotein N-acyltransferase